MRRREEDHSLCISIGTRNQLDGPNVLRAGQGDDVNLTTKTRRTTLRDELINPSLNQSEDGSCGVVIRPIE